MAKGRNKDLAQGGLTSEVKSGEKECAPWLPIVVALPGARGFCVKTSSAMWYFSILKTGGQNKLPEGTDHSNMAP